MPAAGFYPLDTARRIRALAAEFPDIALEDPGAPQIVDATVYADALQVIAQELGRDMARDLDPLFEVADPNIDPDVALRQRGVTVDWAAAQERVGGYQPELYAIALQAIIDAQTPAHGHRPAPEPRRPHWSADRHRSPRARGWHHGR
jgi:hypothetical protein